MKSNLFSALFLLPSLLPAFLQGSLPAQAAAQARPASPVARAVIREARTHSKVMEYLDYLANSIGPRLTGSDNLDLAVHWALGEFERMGLRNCHLEKWKTLQVVFDRGPWWGKMIWKEGGKEHTACLDFNTPAWSAGTRGVVEGPAVLGPSGKKEMEKNLPLYKGKWVVLPLPEGRRRRGGGWGFGPPLATSLLSKGVLGVIIGVQGELLRMSSLRRVRWDKITWETRPTVPLVKVTESSYEKIFRVLEKGIPLKLRFHIQNRFRKGPMDVYNVVADLPGREKPGEYVIVGAHIDSWDGATGSVDNGCGVSTTLEAARLLARAGARPRRTIRFILFSGEEQGLLGSRAYVKAHKDILPRVSAVLVHDGGTDYISGITGTPAMKKDLERAFAFAGRLDPKMPFKVGVRNGLGGGGSDHASFLAAGVPGFFWNQSGGFDYNYIWHTQNDNFEQAIPAYQVHSSIVVALGALGLADLDHLLSREKLRAARRGRRRFRLGVRLDGLTVKAVLPGSPAAKAGLKEGDLFLEAGGKKLGGMRDLFMALFRSRGKVEVLVLRKGRKVKLALDLSRRGPSPRPNRRRGKGREKKKGV